MYNRSNNTIEIQWVEIINKNCKDFLIANGYRPPDGNISDFFEYFEDTLSEIDLTKIYLFFMGDFNIDYLDKKSDNTRKFKATLKQYGLDQLILKPTHWVEQALHICPRGPSLLPSNYCSLNTATLPDQQNENKSPELTAFSDRR